MRQSDNSRFDNPESANLGRPLFEVTAKACQAVSAFFAGREKKPLRVYVSGTGAERALAIALDRERTTDMVYEIDGATWVINRSFLEKAQPVCIDHGADGFEIAARIDLSSPCAGCQAAGKCGL